MDISHVKWKGQESLKIKDLAPETIITLTREIIARSGLEHWDARRLLDVLGHLNVKLKEAEDFLDIEDFVDVLREANNLEDSRLLSQLVDLAVSVLDYMNKGPLLLERVTVESLDNILKSLIVDHFDFVAQRKFVWLHDLQVIGYTAPEMLKMVQKSVRAGPWLSEGDSEKRSDPEGIDWNLLDTEYLVTECHQPNCVHKGGIVNDQLGGLTATSQKANKDACNHEQMRRIVLDYCGLAGVSPWNTGKSQAGRINFHHSDTTVSIYMSEELVGRPRDTMARNEDPQRRPQAPVSIFESSMDLRSRDPLNPERSATSITQNETKDLCQLTDVQTKQIDFLKDAMTRFCKAAAALQDHEYCCNVFTLLVSRSAPDSQFRGVDMVSIAFQTLEDFRQSLSALRPQTLGGFSRVWTRDLTACSTIGERILSIFVVSSKVSDTLHGPVQSQLSVDYHLHFCALATQLVGLGLVFYTQGHLGPLSCPSSSHDLTDFELLGTGDERLSIKADLHELTCLGEMIGGSVFVFQVVLAMTASSASQTLPNAPVDFRGRGVDLVETWGPGLFISEAGAPYGCRLYAIEIGGGVIRPVRSGSTNHNPTRPMFHWSSQYDSYNEMRTLQMFDAWDEIQIGAVKIRSACPLDPEKCRKMSQTFLCNLGTRKDYWELAERQVAFQTGYYTVIQVGNLYARKLGKTVKQQLVEQWSLLPNLRMLAVPWGLQISLCTGIAKRVSLRKLIEDSMFAHVDTLKYDQWHKILPNARAAFQGSICLKSWIEMLSSDEKICLIAIVSCILDLLQQTGVDRKAGYLSVLWPDASSSSYGVRIPCNDENSWTRILQDSESCATFATVTFTCFEGPNHECRNMVAPKWQYRGGLLSTAVCRDLTMERATADDSSQLQLEDGQRYWVGKVSGDCWVVVRKVKDDDVCLIVRSNRFPKVLSQNFWRSNVLRERPDVSFEAEDVLVLGDVGKAPSGATRWGSLPVRPKRGYTNGP